MSNWDDYISKRMLKHAGLLRESSYDAGVKKSRADLEDEYSDLHKEVLGFRPPLDLSGFSDERLQAMIDDLLARAARAREDQRWDRERASEYQSSEAEISLLQPEPGENQIPPGGKMARRYAAEGTNKGSTMRITRGQLRKIIAEEVKRALTEMEILNADSGELLTVDELPPEYVSRLTKADGYNALPHDDFEALRAEVERDMPVYSPMSRVYDEDLDDMSPGAEEEATAAYERLKVLAREVAADYLDDSGGDAIGAGDAFFDLADGLALTSPENDWKLAKQLFGGSGERLKRALAETMAG